MTTDLYDRLEDGHMDHIDAAIWSGTIFHNQDNINAFRKMMSRWEAGLKQAEIIMRGPEELAKEIDRQVIESIKAGANQMAGNGGYSIGTKEKYEDFVASRNYNIPGTEK